MEAANLDLVSSSPQAQQHAAKSIVVKLRMIKIPNVSHFLRNPTIQIVFNDQHSKIAPTQFAQLIQVALGKIIAGMNGQN